MAAQGENDLRIRSSVNGRHGFSQPLSDCPSLVATIGSRVMHVGDNDYLVAAPIANRCGGTSGYDFQRRTTMKKLASKHL